ncbi:MAG: hypothetical protein JNK74_14715 [Candidatus Hydrogenedentes bacterium]|nr:hypothetical protein [Candidatus Hydrogenedentota bacterium]
MIEGYIIWHNNKLSFWSNEKIVEIVGLPDIKIEDLKRISVTLGKTCFLTVPSGSYAGIYASLDIREWKLLYKIDTPEKTQLAFSFHPSIGKVSFIQDSRLHVITDREEEVHDLPVLGLRVAQPTDSGCWIAVGRDLTASADQWNAMATAWILKAGVASWEILTLEISPLQDFLNRHWYEIKGLFSLEVSGFPKIFVGESDYWESCDSLFVEVRSGRYQIFRTGGFVMKIGRDEKGNPYYLSLPGEYMRWNGRRFLASGWRDKISRLLRTGLMCAFETRIEILGNRVRGVRFIDSAKGNGDALVFSSDDLGESWYQVNSCPSGHDWRIVHPIVFNTEHS